jgi:hypothetical protein
MRYTRWYYIGPYLSEANRVRVTWVWTPFHPSYLAPYSTYPVEIGSSL